MSGTLRSSGLLALPAGMQRVIGTLRSANLAVTTDQSFSIATGISKYAITAIWATNGSTTPVLAAGGLYTASSKGGTNLVGVGQVYTALVSSSIILPLTLVAGIVTTSLTAQTLYFSLTTANALAATCDIYVLGVDLS